MLSNAQCGWMDGTLSRLNLVARGSQQVDIKLVCSADMPLIIIILKRISENDNEPNTH